MMICSTCTRLEILQFVVFLLNLCYFKSSIKTDRWRSHLLCLIVRLLIKLDLLCICTSEKLGICHVRRPVSRDRRILIVEMEASKSAHVAYLLQTF